jgi:hypothetical protein
MIIKIEYLCKFFVIFVTEYRFNLAINTQIYVYFEIEKGQVINFVVKLSSMFEKVKYEIFRFDSGHNYPHKDILNKDDQVIRKVWFKHHTNNEILTKSILDIKKNFGRHIERFDKKWFK